MVKSVQQKTWRLVQERLLFLQRAITSPRYLGSITPSSHFLVDTLLRHSNIDSARTVVELGPGTGPFTAGVLARLHPKGQLLCVERDPQLADHLRERFDDPRLIVVTGDARDLEHHLAAHGFGSQVPLVLSGLPFTSLPVEVGEAIMSAIVRCLDPEGCFMLYQYSYVIRPRLRRHFRQVEMWWEVRNIPPAVCMRCTL